MTMLMSWCLVLLQSQVCMLAHTKESHNFWNKAKVFCFFLKGVKVNFCTKFYGSPLDITIKTKNVNLPEELQEMSGGHQNRQESDLWRPQMSICVSDQSSSGSAHNLLIAPLKNCPMSRVCKLLYKVTEHSHLGLFPLSCSRWNLVGLTIGLLVPEARSGN